MTNNVNDAFCVVAIDGGAASGKSSTSRTLAARCGFLHVDTGSHYRAVTYACVKAGVPPLESPQLDRFLKQLKLETVVEEREGYVSLNGKVSREADLRSPEINRQVSHFAALPMVREFVKQHQRDQSRVARDAGFRGLIMEGRDIGTMIFPDAHLKVFLQADPDTRQARRLREGQEDTVGDRDRIDSTRKASPMHAADDAVVIDNSSIGLQDVVEIIIQELNKIGYGCDR